jgi:hypothetical protein
LIFFCPLDDEFLLVANLRKPDWLKGIMVWSCVKPSSKVMGKNFKRPSAVPNFGRLAGLTGWLEDWTFIEFHSLF